MPPADSIPAFRVTGKIYQRFARDVAADAMARYFARTLPGLDTTGTSPADLPGLAELEKY